MKLPQHKSIRLSGYDYSTNGYYFITICTQNMNCIFGNIVNGKMVLNNVGKIIENIWKTLSNRFPIELDIFQIMPNHIHFIIAISNPATPVGAGSSRPTLGQIIGYFKYQITKQINNIVGVGFPDPPQTGAKTAPLQNIKPLTKIFQRNYYEHIIRNEEEYYKIIEYIESNPETWERDRNNPANNLKIIGRNPESLNS